MSPLTAASPSSSSYVKPHRQLDPLGAPIHCAAYVANSTDRIYDLVICRQEGIYQYTIEDRGGAVGLESNKEYIYNYNKYIIIIERDIKQQLYINFYDFKYKFLAGSFLVTPPLYNTTTLSPNEVVSVTSIMTDQKSCYILTSTGTLIYIHERDLPTRIQILIKKSLYLQAITIATEEEYNIYNIMLLYEQYAYHLYSKRDYELAVKQFG